MVWHPHIAGVVRQGERGTAGDRERRHRAEDLACEAAVELAVLLACISEEGARESEGFDLYLGA